MDEKNALRGTIAQMAVVVGIMAPPVEAEVEEPVVHMEPVPLSPERAMKRRRDQEDPAAPGIVTAAAPESSRPPRKKRSTVHAIDETAVVDVPAGASCAWLAACVQLDLVEGVTTRATLAAQHSPCSDALEAHLNGRDEIIVVCTHHVCNGSSAHGRSPRCDWYTRISPSKIKRSAVGHQCGPCASLR